MAKKKKPNLSELIRELKAENPNWSAKQIAEELSKRVKRDINAKYVTNRLSASRIAENSFGRREHRGSVADSEVNYSGKVLTLVKTLIDETGGAEEAKKSIDFFAKLMN